MCGATIKGVVLAALILPTGAVAQNGGWDSIDINGTIIRLGMKKSDALARLAETSTLRSLSNIAGNYCVLPKGYVGPPWDCASVGFIDDKLYTATAEIGTATDTTAAAILNRLYLVILEAERSGMPVQVHTQPEAELKTQQRIRSLSVFIGRKEYSIMITQPVGVPGPSFATLSESIFEPQTAAPPTLK